MHVTQTSSELLLKLHDLVHGYRPIDPLPLHAYCLIAYTDDGQALAGLSCLHNEALGKHIGMIGHYCALDSDAAVLLLQSAIAYFREQGRHHIIGPMDGSTWARYRWVLPPLNDDITTSTFLGEPTNPFSYPAQFEKAGLQLIERYESRLVEELTERPGAAKLQRRLYDKGLRIRTIDLDQYEQSLKCLYELAVNSFSHNPYYTPISQSLFLSKYLAFKPLIDPGCVLIALDNLEKIVGFCFAYPDREPKRLVLKTIAVSPAWQPFGVGVTLIDAIHERAASKNYTQVIHALMHEGNASLQLSKRYYSKPMRHYGLYGLTS